MNKDFFKTTKILDGGMGQELLARGMKPKGTLWSANALVDEKYHNLILNIHNDFIKSGADVIVTTTFTDKDGKETTKEEIFEGTLEEVKKKINAFENIGEKIHVDVKKEGDKIIKKVKVEVESKE